MLSKCIDIVLDLMGMAQTEDERYLLKQLLSELESLIPEDGAVAVEPNRYRGIPA